MVERSQPEVQNVEMSGLTDHQQILKQLALERMSRKGLSVSTSNLEEAVAVRTEPEPEKTVESPRKELLKTEVKFNPKKEGLELRHPAFANRESSLQQPQIPQRQPSRPLSPV